MAVGDLGAAGVAVDHLDGIESWSLAVGHTSGEDGELIVRWPAAGI